MWERIKAHPYLSAIIGVIGIYALYLILRGSGGSSAPQTTDPNYATDVAAGTALQQQQMALASHANDVQASLTALQQNNATQVTLAELESQAGATHDQVNADLVKTQLATESDLTKYTQGLQFNLANKQIDANLTQQAQQYNLTKHAQDLQFQMFDEQGQWNYREILKLATGSLP